MKQEPQSSYYAVIPADVRYSTELSDGAKLLYGEITALSNKTGVCFATNAYFARTFSKGERTICRWFGELRKGGFLQEVNDGHHRLCAAVSGAVRNLAKIGEVAKNGEDNPAKNGDHNNTRVKKLSKDSLESSSISRSELKAWWNQLAESLALSKVRSVTDGRWKKFVVRDKEGFWKERTALGIEIEASSFLKSGGFFGLDWLLENDTNWQKVLEGKYRDQVKTVKQSVPDSVDYGAKPTFGGWDE